MMFTVSVAMLASMCRPPGIVVSDVFSRAVGSGFKSRGRHGCLKMYSAFTAEGYCKQPLSRNSSLERENNLEEGQRPPTSLPLPSTSREDLRLEGSLEHLHAAKALYFYKHACHLRDTNRGSTAQQSASLITIPDGQLRSSCELKKPKIK
ncbi:uncharacterized protein TNCV_1614701 [Trichonephila clavipes]|nr:uncharacterized protein TNCV_1614701 [Trichonephila clavipes]